MYIPIGEVAMFSFITKMNVHDGVYRVLASMSFDMVLEQDIDLVKLLYEPATLDETDYTADVPTIKTDTFYQIQDVTDESNVLYIPSGFLVNIPDPNVFEYHTLGFAVKLGIFADQAKIEWMQDYIAQALEAVTGVNTAPYLFTINSTYMTESEYQAIEDARNALIDDVSNHYTDAQKLAEENTRLKTIIAEYETTLKILNTP